MQIKSCVTNPPFTMTQWHLSWKWHHMLKCSVPIGQLWKAS